MALIRLTLNDTVDLMNSEDYKDRFKAEYYQTKYRQQALHTMILKYKAGKLDFTPTCSVELLSAQEQAMGAYLHTLEIRAVLEEIEL